MNQEHNVLLARVNCIDSPHKTRAMMNLTKIINKTRHYKTPERDKKNYLHILDTLCLYSEEELKEAIVYL